MKTISSSENSSFKQLKKLANHARTREKQQETILEGIHLIEALLQEKQENLIVNVWVNAQAAIENLEIATLLRVLQQKMPNNIYSVTDSLFKTVSNLDSPAPILTHIALPKTPENPDYNADSVLLDGVQDAGNLGSILRSAAAFGFSQILLSKHAASAWSPKTLRAAMGAHFSLALYEAVDLPAFAANFQGKIIATALDAKASLYDLTIHKNTPMAWVFGHEGQGISPALLANVEKKVIIPMCGKTESLNVAAAAAICLARHAQMKTLTKRL